MDALVLKAREFARAVHSSQPRRYTGLPYFTHLEEVAGLVEKAGQPPVVIAAAWLHDVVEDTAVTEQTVRRVFGDEITNIVMELTDVAPAPGLNRAQRNRLNRARLAAASAEAQTIKCADLISNTSTIAKYDQGFSLRYLPEKRRMLDVLDRADRQLWQRAQDSWEAAERCIEVYFAEIGGPDWKDEEDVEA